MAEHNSDLTELLSTSHEGIGIQLEIILETLEKKLDHAITERTELTHAINTLVQEVAVIDGETATRTAELAERAANLLDIGTVITQVKDKVCAYTLEVEKVRKSVHEKLKDKKASLMDGKNRLERVRGALLDLYSEQLVLKASFLAYAGSLKGVTRKTRITREMNDQTHQMLSDMPPLKNAVTALRERISIFKTETAETSVRIHDKILAEREQRFTEAKEQKYLVQMYDEESQILDRLDSDLKLQLDSALEVANKLHIEVKEHETYFHQLQIRLQQALKSERSSATSRISRLYKTRKPVSIPADVAVANSPGLLTRLCPTCTSIGKYCPTCRNIKTLIPGVKKKPSQQDMLIDMENRRSAMKAQIKYLEHKIQQLGIEVYISKMNVEIQMLQTSIKIEDWKKKGFVPTTVQISAVDTSLEAAPQLRPVMAIFAAGVARKSGGGTALPAQTTAGAGGMFAKMAKGKMADMAELSAALTATSKAGATGVDKAKQPPTLSAL